MATASSFVVYLSCRESVRSAYDYQCFLSFVQCSALTDVHFQLNLKHENLNGLKNVSMSLSSNFFHIIGIFFSKSNRIG